MCGRFRLSETGAVLAEQFGLAPAPALEPRYNIAPTQTVATVRQTEAGRVLCLVRWGLVPAWAKDPAIGARMINARAESVAEKPAFRAAFKQRRCLVLADGFYEWQALPGSTGRGAKQPFSFHMADGGVFAFAGLWERWRGTGQGGDDGGAPLETCTIMTTEANELVRPVHERMPVILPRAAYALWLDPAVQQPEPLQALLAPFPAELMASHPVSRAVNRVANDGPECAAAVA